MSNKPLCVQINWQRQLGGGEIYTRFFSSALVALGWDVQLIADRRASFWTELDMPGVKILPIDNGGDILKALPTRAAVIVTHTTLPSDLARMVAQQHRLGGFIHMPLIGRNPDGLSHYHRIFAVSDYVAATARALGYTQVHDQPMLGVADLRCRSPESKVLKKRTRYDWDKRKFRDRVLSWIEPMTSVGGGVFEKRTGLTLGIVSRLTPIKQFPALFSILAPIIAKYPDVQLEIFGSGGYASIRDLRQALTPMGSNVRWWGHQPNPAAIYPALDFVLSGLPEREALGLNLIEAQAAGTPVLAVDSPPFTETVIPGESGFLYTDPRHDAGVSFEKILVNLLSGYAKLDPRDATKHLEKFSEVVFVDRVRSAMTALAG
jgi:glycosyltransferase involved in cell wall biosynthesis